MLLTIYNHNGNIRAEIAPGESSTQQKEVQGDNVLTISFSYYEYIVLDVNDYTDFEGERYWLMEKYVPTQKSDGEWMYDLKLYGIESIIKRFLVLETTDGDAEPVFTLTATPREHVAMIVKCVNNGMGTTDWKVGQVDGTELIVIDYEGKYCDDALKEVAEKVGGKAEWWVEGQTMNVCRCEHGEEITLGYGKGLTELECDTSSKAKFYTRLFPIGSTRNIDPEKYGHSRLMLPDGQKYVETHADEYGIYDHYEKEAFAGIFPRRLGTVSSVRSEEQEDKDGERFTVYYFKDDEIDFDPNSYELPGEVKRVSFQDGELNGLGTGADHYFEVNYDSDTKEFEIITIWPYDDGTQLPGGQLVPKVRDHYILWNIRMPAEFYPKAEQEFLEAVNQYNAEHWLDISVYKGKTDHVWIEATGTVLHVGRRVRLESVKYFPDKGYRDSRITKITRNVNLPGQMDIEISDALHQGSLDRVNDNIGDVRNYVKGMARSISIPDIIRMRDNTMPTDNNLFSAKKSLQEFLSRKHQDVAEELIRFVKGISFGKGAYSIDGDGVARLLQVFATALQSHDYNPASQTGYGLIQRADGKYGLHLTDLEVWGKATFNELETRKVSYVGGNLILSPTGSRIAHVEEVTDGSGNTTGWRCYLLADDGTTATTNLWKTGDQALCETFDMQEGVSASTGNKRYWRKVTGVSTENVAIYDGDGNALYDGNKFAWITLSEDDCETGSDVPVAGDTICCLGNDTEEGRQNAIVLYASGDIAPAIIEYQGINSYTLTDRDKTVISPTAGNKFTGRNFTIETSEGSVRVPAERGEWSEETAYGYYDRVSHNGNLWLCVADGGTAAGNEPTDDSPVWQKQTGVGDEQYLGSFKETIMGDVDQRIAEKTKVTVDGEVVTIQEAVSEIVQNADTISSTVQDVKTTTDGHTTEISNLKQAADSISSRVTAIEGAGYQTQSQVEQTAERVSMKVSRQPVGRKNMLTGSRLYRRSDGHTLGNHDTDEILVGTDGYNVFACNSTKEHNYSGLFFRADTSKNIKVTKGKTYMASVEAMSMTVGQDYQVYIETYYHDGEVDTVRRGSASVVRNRNYIETAGKWTTFTGKITIPDDAAYEYIEVNFIIVALNDAGAPVFYLRKPMLEDTEEYNGWTLAEGDYDYTGGNLLDGTRDLVETGNLTENSGTYTDGVDGCQGTILTAGPPLLSWNLSNMSLTGEDIVLSFLAKATPNSSVVGSMNLSVYLGGTATVTVEQLGGINDFEETTNISMGVTVGKEWQRYWVHWHVKSGSPTHLSISASDSDSDPVICQPKLEIGAHPTQWIEGGDDLVDKRTLLATGIDIEEKKITLTADKTQLRDNSGKLIAMFTTDGTFINTDLVDVAGAIKAKEIDCENATFKNVNISGKLKGVTGSFRQLDAVDSTGEVKGSFIFNPDGELGVDTDFYVGDSHLALYGDTTKGRKLFVPDNIVCPGFFGSYALSVAVVTGNSIRYYKKGIKNSEDVNQNYESSLMVSGTYNGQTYYEVPTAASVVTAHTVRVFPFNMIVFNCTNTYHYALRGGIGKHVMLVNANDKVTQYIAYVGGWYGWGGGVSGSVVILDDGMMASTSSFTPGKNTFIAGTTDNNW